VIQFSAEDKKKGREKGKKEVAYLFCLPALTRQNKGQTKVFLACCVQGARKKKEKRQKRGVGLTVERFHLSVPKPEAKKKPRKKKRTIIDHA